MRFTLLISILLLFSVVVQSQNQRLQEIEVEITKAVTQQDYQRAADLQQEKEILLQIDSAVAMKDYAKAAELQSLLEKGNAGDVKQVGSSSAEVEQPSKSTPSESGSFNLSTTIATNGLVAPSKGKSAVYFVIDGKGGGKVPKYETFANDQYIGYLKQGKYIRYESEPGQQLFWMSSENKEFLTAELLPDKIYIVRVAFTLGWVRAHPGFRVDHDEKELANAVKVIGKKESLSFDEAHLRGENKKLAGFIRENLNRYENQTKDAYNFKHLSGDMFYHL